MKTKDFLRLAIKLFGLYILILSLFTFIRQIGIIFVAGEHDLSYWLNLTGFILNAGALLFLFFWLAFRPDVIIEKFRLDKGFDHDHIPFEKIDSLNILRIGCILVGGIIFLENLPEFLSNCYYMFKQSIQTSVEGMFDPQIRDSTRFDLVLNIINLIVSYLLITNYDRVSKFLLPKENDPSKQVLPGE